MTPSEARSALASALDGAGLSATEKARILAAADEYAATLIDACARSPRDLGISEKPARDSAGIRQWAIAAGLSVSPRGPLSPSVVWLYDSAHRSTG